MKRHHKIILGSFSTIVIISIIAIAIILNGAIVKQNLENTELKQKIETLESSTNGKINEITTELISTKEELISLNENITSTTKQINRIESQAGVDFSGIISEVLESIVIVRTFSSQGSGFFVSRGYLVTNKHVLEDQSGQVSEVIQIVTSDGKTHAGSLVGYINDLDLALIKIDMDYGKLELEDSRNVKIGEKVIAIGTPEGLSFSATDGIVSATDRTGF